MPDRTPTFEVRSATAPAETLLAGFAEFGMAGLTAANYLVEQLGLEQTGHVTADQLPAITPFENGTPRHHTRLFSDPDRELTVLVGELFPVRGVAEPLGDAIMDWLDANDVEEVTVLSGVPIAHAPEDHRTFYVATEDYQAQRLETSDVTPMNGGFLDGLNAHLVGAALDTPLRVGIFTTPVHAQAPDVEAALRLVETVESTYDLALDTGPLESFAEEVANYYTELTNRMAEERPDETVPEDRMYM